MRSPFPGMDPFVETANWPGFQTLLIGEIVAQLVPLVRPRYAVLAASVFHYGTFTIRQVKEYLRDQGLPVRL